MPATHPAPLSDLLEDSDAPHVSSQPQQREARFAHLLQPIRDLAENWSIDVASELEEYLQEVENLQFTFDGSGEKFSFAEAAMLIQGSTCIYSKKVEYLYSLVYETLDLLASKKRVQASADPDDFSPDAMEEFLPLDDMQEDKNVDMREDRPVRDLIPRTPAGLLPVAKDFDAALTTAKGVVLGNRNDFRMNTSVVHDTGTLLLGPEDHHLVEASFHAASTSTVPAPMEHPGFHDDDTGGMDYDDDHEGFAPPPPPSSSLPSPFAPPAFTSTPFARRDDPPSLANTSTTAATAKSATSLVSDPWARLDPHAPGEQNAFHRMKAARLPKSLGPVKTKVRPLQSLAAHCAETFKPATRRLPSNPMLTTAYPEMHALFFRAQRHRTQATKKTTTTTTTTTTTAAAAAASALPEHPPVAEWGGFHDDEYEDNGGFADANDDYDQVPLPEPAAAPPPYSLAFESSAAPSSYEDLVRRHVENYISESQKYVQASDLTRRVQQWESRMRPILEAEERHPAFDIHECGEELLHRFPKGKRVPTPFETIAKGAEVYEVCRMFLAALQLANTHNVELVPPCHPGESLVLRKISDRMMHRELEEFRAPSLL